MRYKKPVAPDWASQWLRLPHAPAHARLPGAPSVFSFANSCRMRALKLLALLVALQPLSIEAGGPKYVAGASYFNPAAMGQSVHWAGGRLNYYVDQGPLNGAVSNQQATAMVDAAAALWSAIPTAGVALTDAGSLNEDVSGANIAASGGTITQPADVTPAADNYPVGVIFDSDGAVIDAIFGPGASDPESCQNDGVMVWLDHVNRDATIAHGVILLNGLCATNADLLDMMSYELERAFGRLLGLDYSQVNPGAQQNGEPNGTLGWPVMQPESGLCGAAGGVCIPSPSTLRYDDIAALNRIYPVTAANLASFPGKALSAANTVSIQGTIAFRNGTGMQGVNVVARPNDADGNPLYEYTVSFVSGAYFNGNHGNPVTGYNDANGNPLTRWGSSDASLQGLFDLSGIPLPPGMSATDYTVSFEAVDPNDLLGSSVGPYIDGSPHPSGTLAPILVRGMAPGENKTLTVSVADSAVGGSEDAIAEEASPRMLAASGMWYGRLSQIGQTDWFEFPVRNGRTFTVLTRALDESGAPTNGKAMPAIGIWDAFKPVGVVAVGAAPGLNGWAAGESWLQVTTLGDDIVRMGIADERGDGRPDYAYQGWVLYADTVEPQRLPASGGPIVIRGMGFRMTDTVLVGGHSAEVTGISPNEITAIAPAAASGITGPVDVEVDDLPQLYGLAIVQGGVSYDAAAGDELKVVSAPTNTVPIGVPMPFTVQALAPDLTAAGSVTVTYTLTSGTATLGCGSRTCRVTASGDGLASINLTAVGGTLSIVTASLSNGSSVQAQFTGGIPPVLTALAPSLSVAAGATFNWTAQALVLNGGTPMGGQAVAWQSATGSGITMQSGNATISNSSGIASETLTVGPLARGQEAASTACLNNTSQCVRFTAFGARPEYALLNAVSGTAQTLSLQGTPGLVTLRLLDMDGNPMAGGTVFFYQALYAWAPSCPPHGRCAEPQLLTTQSTTAVSAFDGTVTFVPASLPGVATKLVGLAGSGNTATVAVNIEQHP